MVVRCLVGVVRHVEGLSCSGATSRRLVLAERGFTVCLRKNEKRQLRLLIHCYSARTWPYLSLSDLSTFDELLGRCLLVVQVSSPCVQGRGLQGTAVGEGQGPGSGQWAVVHGVKVHTGLLFRLATRQEGDSWVKTETKQRSGQTRFYRTFKPLHSERGLNK